MGLGSDSKYDDGTTSGFLFREQWHERRENPGGGGNQRVARQECGGGVIAVPSLIIGNFGSGSESRRSMLLEDRLHAYAGLFLVVRQAEDIAGGSASAGADGAAQLHHPLVIFQDLEADPQTVHHIIPLLGRLIAVGALHLSDFFRGSFVDHGYLEIKLQPIRVMDFPRDQ